jgi:hypothetical protein
VRGLKWLVAGVLCLMVIGLPRQAAAQGTTPSAEISGGYNWLTAKASGDDEWEKFSKGWYADVAGNVTDTLGIVGQVTGNYKTFEDEGFDLNIHTFMAGVRAGSPGRIRGFGQFLVGGARLSASATGIGDFNETDFAIQVGGGVNINGSSPVGLRLGLDWQRVFASEDGEVLVGDDVNGIRFSVGVTFAIGSR